MGGGGSSNFATSGPSAPQNLGQSTPNLFQAIQQNMPPEYFGNAPIFDPTNILKAYMQHLPQFMEVTKSQNNVQQPVAPAATPTIGWGRGRSVPVTRGGQ